MVADVFITIIGLYVGTTKDDKEMLVLGLFGPTLLLWLILNATTSIYYTQLAEDEDDDQLDGKEEEGSETKSTAPLPRKVSIRNELFVPQTQL